MVDIPPDDERREKTTKTVLSILFFSGIILIFFIFPFATPLRNLGFTGQLIIMLIVTGITIVSGALVVSKNSKKKRSRRAGTNNSNLRSVPERPPEYIIKNLFNGKHQINIWNETGKMAVAVLTYDSNKKGMAAVFIPNRLSKQIRGRMEGKFELYFTIGTEWDYNTNEFKKDTEYYKLKTSVDYSTRSTPPIILPADPHQHTAVLPIDKSEFPSMHQDDIEILHLKSIWEEKDNTVFQKTVQELSERSAGKAKPFLSYLKNDDAHLRFGAVRVLGEFRDKTALPDLLETTSHDSDEHIRASAAHSLGMLRDPRAIDPLIKMLVTSIEQLPAEQSVNPREWYIHEQEMFGAGSGLAQIGEDVVEPLMAYCSHNNWRVRVQVANVLGMIGGTTALKGVQEMKDDPDIFVSDAVQNAVYKIIRNNDH